MKIFHSSLHICMSFLLVCIYQTIGITITKEIDLLQAMKKLLRMGPKIVVITSSELEEFPGLLGCYVMAVSGANNTMVDVSRVAVKKIDSIAASFTGTGDCSAALLLGWMHLLSFRTDLLSSSDELEIAGSNLGLALLNTIESVQAVLRRTQVKQERFINSTEYSKLEGPDALKAFKAQATELCLVESRFDILNPPRVIKPDLDGTSTATSPVVNWTESFD